jgi:hypothetical protein
MATFAQIILVSTSSNKVRVTVGNKRLLPESTVVARRQQAKARLLLALKNDW